MSECISERKGEGSERKKVKKEERKKFELLIDYEFG